MSATRLGPGSTEETVWRLIDANDRNGIIKLIAAALKKRSGKRWSVTGGKGTAWGWIKLDAPPAIRHTDAGKLWREELSKLLGKEQVHHQGESIPASSDYRREYLHRALYGHPGTFNAQPYWD